MNRIKLFKPNKVLTKVILGLGALLAIVAVD